MGAWVGRVLSDHPADRRGNVGIDASSITLSAFRILDALTRDALRGTQWVESNAVVADLRMVKDATEIEMIRRAIAAAESALTAVGLVGPGRRPMRKLGDERELAFAIEHEMRLRGATGASFDPIVAAGTTGSLPHYRPGSRRIGDHTTLLIDWGARLDGYCSDLTRTFYADGCDAEFDRVYGAVLDAQHAAIDALVVGATAASIDAAARSVLKQHKLDDYFVHALGHGIGLDVHEGPRMGAEVETPLAAGMVVTVEPGVYLPDRFGVRIEDDVWVTDDGPQVLSMAIDKGLDSVKLIR